MLELIWGLLNIVIFIYFIIVCLKSIKIVREKIGVFASIIFVFGLLSFMAKPNEKTNETKTFNLQNEQIVKNKFTGNTFSKKIKLEDNLTSEITLSIKFGENENDLKLLTAYAIRSGFVSGTNLKVDNVIIEKSEKLNNYHYIVSGILEWRILGFEIYSESKDFEGETVINI